MGNVGQKFIDFFENKKKKIKADSYNDSEISYENVLISKDKSSTKINEENEYYKNKENGLSELFKKFQTENSTRNLISNEKSFENNLNSISNQKDNIHIYSSSNFSNVRNSEQNISKNKSKKHFVQKVKERLERINRL